MSSVVKYNFKKGLCLLEHIFAGLGYHGVDAHLNTDICFFLSLPTIDLFFFFFPPQVKVFVLKCRSMVIQ